jgi:hypothetical protein
MLSALRLLENLDGTLPRTKSFSIFRHMPPPARKASVVAAQGLRAQLEAVGYPANRARSYPPICREPEMSDERPF